MLGLGHNLTFIAQPASQAIAPGNIVLDNLVLWLDAGNVASYPGTGTVWTDISTNGFVCNLVNGPTYSSGNGGSIAFNGMDTYGTIAHDVDFALGADDFTLESWARTEGHATDYYQVLMGNHNAGVGNGFYFYGVNGSNAYGQVLGEGGEAYSNHGETPINLWSHIVASRQSGFVTFYINGVPGAPVEFTDTLTASHPMAIGSLLAYGSYPTPATDSAYGWNGKLSQIRIYKGKGLNAAEVLSNYNAHLSRY